MAQGHEPEAVANARQRLALQRQTLGDRHPEYATGLNQLALLLIMHNEPEQAEPLLREALEIRRESLGEQHPDYATNLSSLAGLLWARGDLDGAQPLLRRSLEIRWEVLGSSHPKTVASMNSLEQLLRAKEDWEGIERLNAGPPVGRTDVGQPEAPPAFAPAPPTEPVGPSHAGETSVTAPVVTAPAWETTPPAAEVHRPGVPSEAAPLPDTETGKALAELGQQVEVLAGEFAGVGERLALAAERWKGGGAPPPEALINEMAACRLQFDELRSDASRLAGSIGVSVEEGPTNLNEVRSLLEFLVEAAGRRAQLEAVRRQAVAVLDRVLGLRHADQPSFAPLQACQAKAAEQRQAIAGASPAELPADATALAEGEHPFHGLLRLVEEGELSDDLWASSMETLEREFGKPLAVAVARSKIVPSNEEPLR